MSRQIAQLIRCETITEEEVKRLCIKAREILIEEANVQVVDSPVTVRVFCPRISFSPLIITYMSSIDMRGYTWAVLGYDGAFQSRRTMSRDKLFVHGCVLPPIMCFPREVLNIIYYR